MSVRKRAKSPYYFYEFEIDGRKFRRSTGATSKAEAEKVEARARVHLESQQKLSAGGAPLRIEDAFTRYYDEQGKHTANAPDIFTDLMRLQDWLLSQRVFTILEISDNIVAKMVTWRRSHYRWGRPECGLLTPAAVNRSGVHVLRRVMVRARDVWKLPLPNMPKWGNHLLEEPEERVRVLSADENAALHEVIDPDYEVLRRFSIASGLRQKESLLQWSNIDWSRMTIEVPGKRKKMMRRPITDEMAEILRSRRGHHPKAVFTHIVIRPRDDQKKGERHPITAEGLKTHWRRRRARAGIEGYRWHDNRHTFATDLLRATGNLKMVQLSLNHAKIDTTTKYAHVLDDELRAGMELASSKRRDLFESETHALPHTVEARTHAKTMKNKKK
jgi:integrase